MQGRLPPCVDCCWANTGYFMCLIATGPHPPARLSPPLAVEALRWPEEPLRFVLVRSFSTLGALRRAQPSLAWLSAAAELFSQ